MLCLDLVCFVQAKTLCRYGCMYFLAALLLVCVDRCDGDVVCVGHDLNWCSWWWYACRVYVGFASLDVVCDELNDCAWNLGL